MSVTMAGYLIGDELLLLPDATEPATPGSSPEAAGSGSCGSSTADLKRQIS